MEDLQRKYGLAYLFIAHDLAVVRHISMRVVVMYFGRIMEVADRDVLYREPLHPYTQALLDAAPVPDPTIEKGREPRLVKGELPAIWRLHRDASLIPAARWRPRNAVRACRRSKKRDRVTLPRASRSKEEEDENNQNAKGENAMPVKIRTLLLVGAALALGASVTQAQTPKKGGVLNFSVSAEPPNYDCHANSSFAFIHPVRPHYSTLLEFDPANYPKIRGDLATSWETAKDGLTYTFKLRPNVKFHDGTAMTSADVKASYDRIVNPPAGVVSLRKAAYSDISSIEAPDPQTVVFKLTTPNASMLANFASPWDCIYSAAKLKQDPKWPEKKSWGPGRSSSSSTPPARIGSASASPTIMNKASLIWTATRPSSLSTRLPASTRSRRVRY